MPYTEILGRVVRGLGAAAMTIRLQRAHFEALIPEMKVCHDGTINLRLEQPLRIDNPDCVTDYDWGAGGTERFGILRIGLEFPVGGVAYPAWVYIPHGSPHFHDRSQIEVLAALIEGISYGARCRVLIPRARIERGIVVV